MAAGACGELGLGHPIADDAGNVRAGGDETFDKPRADEAGAPGDQRGAILPEFWVACDHCVRLERKSLGRRSDAARKLSGAELNNPLKFCFRRRQPSANTSPCNRAIRLLFWMVTR